MSICPKNKSSKGRRDKRRAGKITGVQEMGGSFKKTGIRAS